MKLRNQSVYNFSVELHKNSDIIKLFEGGSSLLMDDGLDYYGRFPPSGFGLKQLGFADYRKVVTTISRYVPAEVAQIENVMASEYREMATINELTKEITDFESTENSKENETETISTDRFQLQNEISQMLSEQNKNNFDTKLSTSYGTATLDMSYGTSTLNSKESSNRQALTKAQEVTNKAVEKILTKVRKERTVKVTQKFTASNKHGFDNRGNAHHVSGIYRHINAVYKNQIYNYGKRLMFEFAIPEPALFHKLVFETQGAESYLK
ncbi:MAG: hypothetical protein IPG22_23380 [Acidobacteria bacterium]|nr:hypothetical protein [Acidobacteriota bacterium]